MTRNLVYWSLLKAKGFLGKELREIESVKNEEDLERFIEKYLETLLMHAYHHVKYYKKVFEEISIFKNGEIVLSEFNSIPILTKSIIRQYRENLISDDYMKRKWYYNSSGGSTGEPVRFIQDDIYDKWAFATSYYYYKNFLGIEEPLVKKVLLWGSERYFSGEPWMES